MKGTSAPRITDVALITHNFDAATDFYLNKVGLELRSFVQGFVDFEGPGVILSLWDASLFHAGTGITARPPQ